MPAADLLFRAARPLLFAMSPDRAHAATIRALALLDAMPWLAKTLAGPPDGPVTVGGARLPSRVIVAAGLVKGHGFADEAQAVEAAARENIIPGWRSVPLLSGAVEFGSFTRWPRIGNPAPVLWRDVRTRSTQNRVGLKNPGALAASAFLAAHRPPGVYGISIATTPGERDPAVQAAHVGESIRLFLGQGIRPRWFTINLSCPNTDDDPQATQTEALAAQVTTASVAAADDVPVWVKIGPDLSDGQYRALIETFAQAGIKAVVATNTLGAPALNGEMAGIGGGSLYERALCTVLKLFAMREKNGYRFDIVGCGGILDGTGLRAYTDAGASAAQIWTALVYRGPFAPRHILREYESLK